MEINTGEALSLFRYFAENLDISRFFNEFFVPKNYGNDSLCKAMRLLPILI